MRTLMVFACALFAAGLYPQEPQAPVAAGAKPEPGPVKPEDKCSIEGNIYSLTTGEPLKEAEVQMQRVDSGSELQIGASTDIAGHFVIESLDPGGYTLTATRNGYVTTTYGSKGRPGAGTTITLNPGTKMKDIAVKLPVQAVMTGKVVDEDGEPMARVAISLLQRGYRNGRKIFWTQAGDSTDDRGEYRVYGIAPGKYYVSANARPYAWSRPEVRNDKGEQFSYAPVFYPNANAASDATLMEISSGAELSGIDFRLVKTRAFKISGKLLGQRRTSFVQLMPADLEGGPLWERMNRAQTDDKGTFVFRGIRPGRYTLTANARTVDEWKSARLSLAVADADIEGIQLALMTNPDLAGSVRIEGSSERAGQQMAVSLQPEEDIMGGSGAEVKDDGTFKLRSVPLERMRVSVWKVPDGHYLKSIRAGDREVEGTLVDFREGVPGALLLTLSPKAATITGSVKDAKDQAATSGVVVLVPDDRKRLDLYFSAGPDQNGTYTIRNVRPGSYKVFAFDSAETGAYQDPDWLKKFDEKGESLEVKEGEKPSKDLKLIVTGEAAP